MSNSSCPSDTYGCDCGSVSVWQQEGGYQALVAMGTIAVLTGFILLHVASVVRVLVPDPNATMRLVLGADNGNTAVAQLRRLLRVVDAVVASFLALGALFVASALSSPLHQGGSTPRPFIDYSGGVAFAWIAFVLALSALSLAVYAIRDPRGPCTGARAQFLHVAFFRLAWVVCVWTFAAQVNPDMGATLGVLLFLYALVVAVLMFRFTRTERARYQLTEETQNALEEGGRLVRSVVQATGDALEEKDGEVVISGKKLRRLRARVTVDGNAARDTAVRSVWVALYALALGVCDILLFAIPGTVIFMRVGCTWGQ